MESRQSADALAESGLKFPARHARPSGLFFEHDGVAQARSYLHPRKRSRRPRRGIAAAKTRAKTFWRGRSARSLSLQPVEAARPARKIRVGHGFHLRDAAR